MLYQFDMGEGKSRYYLGNGSPVDTYHGLDTYHLRKVAPPTPPVVGQWEVEPCGHVGIAMEFYSAAEIIKCDGKFGVLLRDKCFGMNDGARYGASSYPCVYDDMKIPNFGGGAYPFKRGNVPCGYIPVCKGGKWTNLLLAEPSGSGEVTSALAGPFVFDTAEEAEKWMAENGDLTQGEQQPMNTTDNPVRFMMAADIQNSGTDGLDPAGCDAAIEARRTCEGQPMWNANDWANDFSKTSRRLNVARAGGMVDAEAEQTIRRLRQDVFRDTVARVQAGGYDLPDVGRVALPLSRTIASDTRFYSSEIPARPGKPGAAPVKVEVREGDCLVVAHDLITHGANEVCVLNMANRQTPGGGVYGGAGAQEEHLFRSSDYFRSLYQFAANFDPADYGVGHARERYPLDQNFGGVFSRGVTVFRGPEPDGYPLLAQPWRCNFVAVPAINRPETMVGANGEERLVPAMADGTRNKIRTILRICRENGQRNLVLGAFGCGAFRNPPRHVAELFKEVIASAEFAGAFDHIVFAIIENHNSRGVGNFKPFKEVFI